MNVRNHRRLISSVGWVNQELVSHQNCSLYGWSILHQRYMVRDLMLKEWSIRCDGIVDIGTPNRPYFVRNHFYTNGIHRWVSDDFKDHSCNVLVSTIRSIRDHTTYQIDQRSFLVLILDIVVVVLCGCWICGNFGQIILRIGRDLHILGRVRIRNQVSRRFNI